MLEPGQLQTFMAVARLGSFSKAAEQLGVTQSAISQSIKNIEGRLSAPLFSRSGKQIVLTPEGKLVYDFTRETLEKFEDLSTHLSRSHETLIGKVRIGTLYGIGKTWLAPQLIDLAQDHEGLSIRLTLGFPNELIHQFQEQKLDLLILPDDLVPSKVNKWSLGEERSLLVYPSKDPFNIKKSFDLEKLSSLPIILYEDDDDMFSKWCMKIFGSFPGKLNKRLVVNSHGNILRAVSHGLGISVVPSHVVSSSSHKKGIKTLGAEYEVLHNEVFLVAHPETSHFAKMTLIREYLLNSPFKLSHVES